MKNEAPRDAEGLENPAGGRVQGDSTTDLRHTHPDAAEVFADCFAVVVYGRSVRRHIYLALASAERAVHRAHERGDDASMTLVRLLPAEPTPIARTVRRPDEVDAFLRNLESSGVTP